VTENTSCIFNGFAGFTREKRTNRRYLLLASEPAISYQFHIISAQHLLTSLLPIASINLAAIALHVTIGGKTMKHQSFLHRSVLRRAIYPVANALKVAGRSAPLVILCLAALALGVVSLTKVSGALGAPATPQAGGGAGNPTYTFTTIDVPVGGTGTLQGTIGSSINFAGDITGVYLTAPNVAHGFVRPAATGTIATFDAPNAGTSLNQGTFPSRIGGTGHITGMYADLGNAYHGFLRAPDGAITEFDVTGAPTNTLHRGTVALSINAALQITGFYVDANAVRHGFLRAPDGTFTTFDAPGAGTGPTQGTIPLKMNPLGGIVGCYIDGNQVFHGFFRFPNGTIFGPIDDPNASKVRGKGIKFGGTVAHSFDGLETFAGIYADANFVFHGFLFDPNGPTFTTIDVPGAGTVGLFSGTLPTNMDGVGDITGTYSDANGVSHGFVRLINTGAINAPLDAPGAGSTGMFSGTVPFAINGTGELTGAYVDSNAVFHGFLATASAAATPSFNPPAGTYAAPQSVTISDATPGATIFYTTDGTTPNTGSAVFSGPITVSSTKTIQAIAAAFGFSNSAVATAIYTIGSPPMITSISPTSAIAGGTAFNLTVNGTNFVSGSTARFNGNARATTFVSATQLTAAILASDIASAGSFSVTVTNPGGGTSNAVSFTALTPQQATQAVVNSVNALFAQGVLNGGQDNSLVAQLQHAITMMNAGKNAGAIGNLDSFISEVNDLLSSGVLSPSQAAPLVSAAQNVIASLS
jgi:hypothetical protein